MLSSLAAPRRAAELRDLPCSPKCAPWMRIIGADLNARCCHQTHTRGRAKVHAASRAHHQKAKCSLCGKTPESDVCESFDSRRARVCPFNRQARDGSPESELAEVGQGCRLLTSSLIETGHRSPRRRAVNRLSPGPV